MKRILAVLILGIVVFTGCGPGTNPVDRLATAQNWVFGLGVNLDAADTCTRLGAYDLVVIDGEDASPELVTCLKGEGSIVLGYLSVGTIENWRSWYPQVEQYRLQAWPDWEGEWYADLRQQGYRDVLLNTVAPNILAKGFEGLFLDNVDMIAETHHELDGDPVDAQELSAGMYALVQSLGTLVHTDGRILFTQNGYEVTQPVLGSIDGWNHEDVTSTYVDPGYARTPIADRDEALQELRDMDSAGVFTTATDYTGATQSQVIADSVSNACAVGALPFVSNIALTRLPSEPFACP